MRLPIITLCAALTACATGGTGSQNREADAQRIRALMAYMCAVNPYDCPRQQQRPVHTECQTIAGTSITQCVTR